MQFGVAFIPGFPAEQTIGLAAEAERLGYDYLFLPDQTFHRDPFTLLGLCAHATQTIRLGLGVTNPYSRHPVQIARSAGTVADISDGHLYSPRRWSFRVRRAAGDSSCSCCLSQY